MEKLFKSEIENISKNICPKCQKCEGKIPKTPWEKMPNGCWLEGVLFQIREKIKQRIRKQKEEILDLNVYMQSVSTIEKEFIENKIINIQKEIDVFEEFGSKDW